MISPLARVGTKRRFFLILGTYKQLWRGKGSPLVEVKVIDSILMTHRIALLLAHAMVCLSLAGCKSLNKDFMEVMWLEASESNLRSGD